MARGKQLAFLFVVIAALSWPTEALSCSCAPADPVCEVFSRTSAVFTAEVLSIEDDPLVETRVGQPPPRRRVTLRVERIFRGAPAKQVEVTTARGEGDCGYPFKRGEKYLVFATELDGRLQVSVCSPTRPLAEAAKQLDEINATCVNQPPQLVVRGSVVRPDSRAASAVSVTIYLITSAGPRIVASVVTDRRGTFSMRVTSGQPYRVVASSGNERAEVGPFELTPATAPILLVMRPVK